MNRRAPKGNAGRRAPGLRPTAGRVRAAIFNSLGGRISGARVLDLFAGTGALGLEALRRGAASAVFVERDPALAGAIRTALAREGFADAADVTVGDALRAVAALGRAGRRFELILLDPPYGGSWLPRTLAAIVRAGILEPGGVVVAEGHWRDRPQPPPGLAQLREARYGETAVWFFAGAEGGTA